jgi:hypothetical protein
LIEIYAEESFCQGLIHRANDAQNQGQMKKDFARMAGKMINLVKIGHEE